MPRKIIKSFLYTLIMILMTGRTPLADSSIAMHGQSKYAEHFKNFDYANPQAPKGGHLRLPIIGSFDSLQPFLIKGVSAAGLGLIYQSLLTRSKDEPFSLYANLAKSFEVAPDRSWIRFDIDPLARFSDGSPLTTADVFFSYQTLKEKGRPNHRQYYSRVASAKILSKHAIQFNFKLENVAEMPLIMGLMPIISKRHFDKIPFEKAGFDIPMGTGPYKLAAVDPGRSVTYERDLNFWGQMKPQFSGRFNFDRISFEYFRDTDVVYQAFLAQNINVYFEQDPAKWIDRQKNQLESIGRQTIDLSLPPPFLGIVFNTRKDIFADPRVRKALTLAYDFEWANQNLLHGLYKRTQSYFEAGNLKASGIPKDLERDMLAPYSKTLPPRLYDTAFSLPRSDGSGRIRGRLMQAKALLGKAGWTNKGQQLFNPSLDSNFTIEMLLVDRKHLKLITGFKKNLKILGIDLRVRLLDSASFQNRITDFDFDMMITEWGQSLSPGNEQAFYWSSHAAKTPGSRNYPGIQEPAIDHLVQVIASAKDRETLEAAVRALDRSLLWGYYAIPLHHSNQQWIYHSKSVQFPINPNFYGTTMDLWWKGTVDDTPLKRP